MASPSFQATIFDYLRVVFHRLHVIILFVLLAVGVAWIWITWLVPRSYQSKMTVMVWSPDMDNPMIKRMVQQAPMDKVINTIRNKLQVEKRLRNMVCNVRLAVKEEKSTKLQSLSNNSVPLEALHLELLRFPKKIHIGPRKWDERFAFLFDYVTPVEAKDETVYLEHIADYMDTQSLARILAGVEDSGGDITADQVIRDVNDDERYVGALRRTLFGDRGKAVAFEKVRKEAVKRLKVALTAEKEQAGAGGFSEYASVEILKEIHAIEFLMNVRLYQVAHEFAGTASTENQNLTFWVQRLKAGLDVGGVHRNLMTFKYDEVLYRLQRPYHDSYQTNVVSHIVVNVAYAMIEREFRTAERQQWDDALKLRVDREKDLQQQLDVLNEELYNYAELSGLQLSFLNEPQVDMRDPMRPMGPHWNDAFLGVLQPSTHIHRIDEYVEQIREADGEISGLHSQIAKLREQIDNPSERYIEVRQTIHKEDPPEMKALRGQLVLKQLEMRKLLDKNTLDHPFVRKLKKEVDEIKAALSRHKPATTMEEIERTENPELREWKRMLEDAEIHLSILEKKREHKRRIVEEEKGKAEQAIKKQRAYQDKQQRQQNLRKQLTDVQEELEEIGAKRKQSENFAVEFERHTDSRRPGSHYAPKEGLVLLMALLLGLLAAGGMVFLTEYTDHSIKTSEDVRRHLDLPVLGNIPEFAFSSLERVARGHRGSGWLSFLSRENRSPQREEGHPEPAENGKSGTAKMINPRNRVIILALVLSAVVLGGLLLVGAFDGLLGLNVKEQVDNHVKNDKPLPAVIEDGATGAE